MMEDYSDPPDDAFAESYRWMPLQSQDIWSKFNPNMFIVETYY